MNDNIKNKLLVINKFNLPSEILNLVKTYAFYDYNEEKKKHKVFYSPVIDEINSCILRIRNLLFENNFWITEETVFWMFMNINRTVILQSVFCKRCGDYVESSSGLYQRISCFCNNPVVEND